MSMNCFGCYYNSTNEDNHSFCKYYNETKHNMDRERGTKYLRFRHGGCSHDTRKQEEEGGET